MRKCLSQLAVYIIFLALLAGCAPVVEQPPAGPIVLSDELLALMETVNREHQAIVKPKVDEAAIVERWARDTSKYALDYQIAGGMTDGVLTAQQAKNDVNELFYNIQTRYGLYEYFGGDDAFEQARQAIFRDCDEAGTLKPSELADVLVSHLSFVKDCHFQLDNYPCAKAFFAYHYREVEFEKTPEGYQTVAGKKRVASVDGHDDLDNLFRRSISGEGIIVYYPVVLVELAFQDYAANPSFAPENLIVRYDDGNTESLTAEPNTYDMKIASVELYEKHSIPVLFARKMGFDEAGDSDGQAFLTHAHQLKGEPIAILDLRSNGGGNSTLPYKWLNAYTGERVTGNCYSVSWPTLYGDNPSNPYFVSSETMSELLDERRIGGGLILSGGLPDAFVANDNLLITLTSKRTGSAAECMVDLLHNVRNTLIVGDPTLGCYVGSGATIGPKLRYSQIQALFGGSIRIFPEGEYFQEMRGFLPDLWVPAADAEELAIKLILNNR